MVATPPARVSNACARKRQGPSCDAQAGMVSGNTWDESLVLLGTSSVLTEALKPVLRSAVQSIDC